MFKLSIHEKIENEREKAYLCRKDMFHLLIYIRYGKDIWFRNHKKKGPCIRRAFLQHEPLWECASYNCRHAQAMPCLRIAIVYVIITPAKIALFFETIKHLADYFQKRHEKTPMRHAPGLTFYTFLLFEIPVPIPYRTDPIRNGWSELLTHACGSILTISKRNLHVLNVWVEKRIVFPD